MSKISLEGNASGTGTFTVAAPNTNTNYTITLPQETGTLFTTGATTGLNASALTTGIVAVGVGGTGANTLTSEAVIIGNATSAVKFVSPGTSGNVLTSNGTAWASTAPAAGGQFKTELFASTTTWVAPTGVTSVRLLCIGGGGGGGAGQDIACGPISGGAGGYGGFDYGMVTVSPSTTYTVTVGAGGAGANSGAGAAGGETWFGVNSSTKIGRATGGGGGTAAVGSTPGTNGADGAGQLGNLRKTVITIALMSWLGNSITRASATSSTAAEVWSSTALGSPGRRGSGEVGGSGSNATGGCGGVIVIEYVG